MQKGKSVKVDENPEPKLDVKQEEENTIDFENLFLQYAGNIYKKKKDIADKFLMANEKCKLTKRKYYEMKLQQNNLKNQIFNDNDSDSEIDFAFFDCKVPKFGSQP